MQNAPVFVEAPVDNRPQILLFMRSLLTHDGFTVLPSASNLEELRQVALQIERKEFKPSVFVVNTCGTEDLLEVLDPLIGSTPAVFLHRQSTGHTSIMRRSTSVRAGITSCLQNMKSEHKGIWRYNDQTWMYMALRSVERLENYFRSHDPNSLEMEMSKPAMAQLEFLPNYQEQAQLLKQLARDHEPLNLAGPLVER
jgi:hypothetical protein